MNTGFRKAAMVTLIIGLLLFGGLAFVLGNFLYKSFRGAPYVPLNKHRIQTITALIKPGDRVADLGCGDARVLIEAIKQGAESAQGWELDVLVYLRAKRNLVTAQRLGVDTRSISLHFGDFWRARLESVDVVYVYQMTKYMHPLEEKIISQLKPGALIISPDYQIPGLTVWKYIDDGDRGVYVYKKQ